MESWKAWDVRGWSAACEAQEAGRPGEFRGTVGAGVSEKRWIRLAQSSGKSTISLQVGQRL